MAGVKRSGRVGAERQPNETGPARLGNLERAFMEALWEANEAVSARSVQAACVEHDLAYATVRTVLNRLAEKGLVNRVRADRAWLYEPVASRDSFVAELMLQALELTGDREAALAAFARVVKPAEAEALRQALGTHGRRT